MLGYGNEIKYISDNTSHAKRKDQEALKLICTRLASHYLKGEYHITNIFHNSLISAMIYCNFKYVANPGLKYNAKLSDYN